MHMVSDPIGDMIIQIKNAALAGKKTVTLPYSKEKEHVARIICDGRYLTNVEKSGENPKFRLKLTLSYKETTPMVTDVKRMSKPGIRRYVKKDAIPLVMGGLGLVILSTSQGIMSGKEAKQKGIGGEYLLEIW